MPLRFKDKNFLVVLFKSWDESKGNNYLVTYRIETITPEMRSKIAEDLQGHYEFSSNLIPSSDIKRLMVEKTLLDRQMFSNNESTRQKIPLKTEYIFDSSRFLSQEFNLEIEGVALVDNPSLYESIVQELLIIMIRNDPKRNEILTHGNDLLAEGATLGHFLMYSKLLKTKQEILENLIKTSRSHITIQNDEEDISNLKRLVKIYILRLLFKLNVSMPLC